MKLITLIRQLNSLETIYGGDVEVVLDDFYTKASRPIDTIFVENGNEYFKNKKVIVLRD